MCNQCLLLSVQSGARLFACLLLAVIGCFFSSSLLFAGTYCNLDDVPLTEVVTGTTFATCGGGRDGLSTSRFQGSTSSRTVCTNYYLPRNYLGTGLIYPSPWYVSPGTQGSGSCSPRGSMEHLSKVTSTAEACGETFNKDDLKAYDIVINRIQSSSACTPVSTTVNYASYRLKKITASISSDVVCAYESPIPEGWVITGTGTSSNCSTSNVEGNTWKIQRIPATGTIISCGLPDNLSNFVYRQTSGTCNNTPRYEIGYAIDGGQSCGVPSGMVATAATSSSLCTGPLYTVRFPQNNMVACQIGNPPDPNSFVVNSVGTSPNCRPVNSNSTGATWVLRTPAAGVDVCANYGLPTSWGYQNPQTNASSCGGGYRVTLASLTSNTSYCYKPSLPDGWVYRAVTSTISTLCSTQLQYQVAQPATSGTTNICYFNQDSGPVPSGYMVVSNRQGGTTCVQGSPMQIAPVRNGLQVCTTQNLPADYVITNTYAADSNCSFARYEINQASGNGPYFTCNAEQIPAGFLITGVNNSISCGSTPSYRIEKPRTSGTTEVCLAQNLDRALLGTGLVVLGYNNSNQSCVVSGFTQAYLMGYPSTTGRTTICTTRLDYIPEGYQQYQTGNYSVCNNNPGMIIEPVASQGAIPDSFVLPEPDIAPSSVPSISYDCGGTGTSTVISGASRNTAACP